MLGKIIYIYIYIYIYIHTHTHTHTHIQGQTAIMVTCVDTGCHLEDLPRLISYSATGRVLTQGQFLSRPQLV